MAKRSGTEQKTTIIYVWTHKATRKKYVGLTVRSLKERIRDHERYAFKEQKQEPLYEAVRKHGRDAFTCEILATVKGMRKLGQVLESSLIYLLETHKGAGFNKNAGCFIDGSEFYDERPSLDEYSSWSFMDEKMHDLKALMRWIREHKKYIQLTEDEEIVRERIVKALRELNSIREKAGLSRYEEWEREET